jgi:4-hydroxy-tetrahydrodipicolinate synthase
MGLSMLQPCHLLGALIPAVPVPFTSAGQIDTRAHERYVQWMVGQPIEGVAIWAHTGRGLRLGEAQRAVILRAWRKALVPSQFVVAAAGSTTQLADPAHVMISARTMACQAADLGADALLVHPPVAFRDRPDLDTLVLDYHAAVAEAGLPLILFYLYEDAGGVRYGGDLLTKLLARPDVLGIKVATLNSVMTFQDLATLIEARAPDKVLVTGEDRFLGYSLMCGAQAALIGMGAACTTLQSDLLQSFRRGQFDRFLRLNRAVDDLARHTFLAPMEGYIVRMLWCLVHQGVIPLDAANDPWGPRLDPSEFVALGGCLKRIESDGLRDLRS